MTPVRLRPLAETDLIERTRYDRSEAGDDIGERFFESAVATLQTISAMPGAGSRRLGEWSDIPGLRSFRIEGFPCGWLYLERDDYVDVVRLLSYAQDLPAHFADEED
ncbi:MAG: type II toxin-antitoxin system RelE/ParE family toxin [Acidimicrobiales bacterium]|nr:type II toxin-antitoxin system RelE/ParE family toxin [Acidimicrobiales bacterium]